MICYPYGLETGLINMFTKIGIQFAKRFFKEKEYLFNKKRALIQNMT